MSSARELLERDLVAPLFSPWLVPRDVMSLSETSKACLREVRAGLSELNLNEKCGITNEHVITIVRCFPSLRLLGLNCVENITDAAVSAIARLSMLRELSDESIVALASRCTRLQSIDLQSRQVTDVSFKALARYASCLRRLDVRCPITDAGLIPIGQQCPQLHTVSFKSPFITDDGIAALSGLIDLAMHDNGAVTALAIAHLVVRSPGLVWLSTYNCPGWRDRGGKGHELARLLHEHLPNPERSHPRIMQFLPKLTPREQ